MFFTTQLKMKIFLISSLSQSSTLKSQIVGGVGIIGGFDIVIIINNGGEGVGIIGRVGQGWKNSVGGFLVLIC